MFEVKEKKLNHNSQLKLNLRIIRPIRFTDHDT